MGTDLLPAFIRDHYEVHEWKHACAILHQDFPQEWADLVALLTDFRLYRSQLVAAGGKAVRRISYGRTAYPVGRILDAPHECLRRVRDAPYG
jgi:hypothetical protein